MAVQEHKLSVDEARARLLAHLRPLKGSEEVPLPRALGRILAENLVSQEPIPPFDNSAMDGFAVRAVDIAPAAENLPVSLRVQGTIQAGAVPLEPLKPHQAFRIMTGAPVPIGADTILIKEFTRDEGDRVYAFDATPEGYHIRRKAQDIAPGDVVIKKGRELDPVGVAVHASLGAARAKVFRRPRVAIVSTGDEIVELFSETGEILEERVGAPLREGQIRNSNGVLLWSLCRRYGADPVAMIVARDTLDGVVTALARGAEMADVILSTGGVSVGQFDYLKDALDRLGAKTEWWKVKMKPGKPFVYGRLGDTVILSMPGNPASALVSFHMFARPVLRRLSHLSPYRDGDWFVATLSRKIEGDFERVFFARGHLEYREGRPVATVPPKQGSHILSDAVGADILVVVPAGVCLPAGEDVQCLRI